jgi:hypothetical protein
MLHFRLALLDQAGRLELTVEIHGSTAQLLVLHQRELKVGKEVLHLLAVLVELILVDQERKPQGVMEEMVTLP